MADVYRRCACRGEDGRQLGAKCPRLVADAKHGSWSFYLAAGINPKTGKRMQNRKSGFPTKKAAQQARNELATKLDRGTYTPPSKETYGDYLDRWLKRRQTTGASLRATSVDNYSRHIRRDIKPTPLGVMKISEIRRAHVQAFIDDLIEAGRGATTIRRIIAVVQGSLRSAGEDDLNDPSPGTGLKLPQVERKEITVWEPDQVGRFLDTAAGHRLGSLFEVAIFTGMRRGELLGLKWSDVDLASRTLTIRNNRTQAGKQVVENAPKTRAGRRTVELADVVSSALVTWKLRQETEAAEWGDAYEPSGYVWTYENGEPLKPQYVSRLFDKLRLKADLPKLTFHGQRHESASLMIAGGEDLAVISKMLGHSSYSITSDLYTHLVTSAARNASEKAAALVPRQNSTALTT